jgi:membrane protease YdiL (CAAX protease family)
MSTMNRVGSRQIAKKLGLSALFLIATSLFFLGDHINPGRDRIVATAISAALLLGLTILLYRSERFHKYWEVSFAFFTGSFGLFLAWNIPDPPLSVIGASMDTPQGVAVLKFYELLPLALVIIVLTEIVQGSLSTIYIQRGDLRSGLGLGFLLGIFILVVYFVLSWSTINLAKAIAALPWLIFFAVSNAFFEELLIRGLFLKRYIALLGTAWALVLSALCYGLFFLGVQAAVGPIPYSALVVILPLGFMYGFIMQRSDSIWGPVSIHAVVDLIFLLGVFASI